MTLKTVVVTDDFSTNNFHDARDVYTGFWSWTPTAPPALHLPFQSTIEQGALSVPEAGLGWWDLRHSVQDGFTSARVWADIASANDYEDMQAVVGWMGLGIIVSLKPGEQPKATAMPSPKATPNPQSNASGFSGGPVTQFSDTTPELALDIFSPGVSSRHPNSGPGNVGRAAIAPGRVELIFTPDGAITVTGPDGTQLAGSTDDVADYINEPNNPLYPFVNVQPGVGADNLVLSAWGYEIDYPVPPPVPGTVVAGQGATGALRH